MFRKKPGENLEVLLGLPTEDIFRKYISDSKYSKYPALCELSIDDVREADATVWAPRWTTGNIPKETVIMHQEGRRVFTWTLDVQDFIREYMTNTSIDGILTNYPALVAYEYYTKD